MTTEDPKAEVQKLRDMLQMLSNQRNSAQNECVQLGAALTAANRKIEALEKAAAGADKADAAPKANGRVVDAEVVAQA